MEFIKIDEYSKSLDNLGFYEWKMFKFIDKTSKQSKEILSNFLRSGLYFDLDHVVEYTGSVNKKYKLESIGPILSSIDISDFDKLTFNELGLKIKEFESEEDWGEDLPIFKKIIIEVFHHISSIQFTSETIYYLNKNTLPSDILLEFDDFAYYLSIIIISPSDRRLLVINIGED